MAKLGSKKRPIILRASTRVDGERAMRICEEHGWHYIVGFEPDKRQDFSDLDKALRSLASPSPALEEQELSGIMIPLVEVLPDLAHRETRCIIILHDDGPLPRGEYGFVELYCADDACDCRRVLVHVFHGPESPRLVATINHGFDEPSPDDGDLRTFLDPLGAQGELADEVLDTFETILLRDPVYVRRLESHYALFKEAVGDEGTRRRLVAPRAALAARSARNPKPRPPAQKVERPATRSEQAFLCDAGVTRCLGQVERSRWERAIAAAGGSVARAADACGLADIPNSAKALRGKSADEAMSAYHRGKKQRR